MKYTIFNNGELCFFTTLTTFANPLSMLHTAPEVLENPLCVMKFKCKRKVGSPGPASGWGACVNNTGYRENQERDLAKAV